jgi:inner membrane protein
MDPVSQGAVGAAFAQSSTQPERIRAYALFGCLGGLAPDLDVFIQSSTDPLLFLEFHRHFTHALIFIPVGALIVCAALFKLTRHPLSWRQAYLACFIGYATHGLLDACTSYGTQLLWPFSDARISWNNVSVIDPLATIPLLAFVLLSVWKQSRRFAVAGVVWFLGYLLVGLVQHERAMATAYQMAAAKGHTPHRLTTKPGFANLLLWKSIYEHEGHYYVDAIRVGADRRYCSGDRIEAFDYARHLPGLDRSSQQARDIERFRWFSDDYIASIGHRGDIVDVRYSTVPNEIDPLWGIRIDLTADNNVHADFISNPRATAAQTRALWSLLKGEGCVPFNHQGERA